MSIPILNVVSDFLIFSKERLQNDKKHTPKSSKKVTKVVCMLSCAVYAQAHVHVYKHYLSTQEINPDIR